MPCLADTKVKFYMGNVHNKGIGRYTYKVFLWKIV